MDFISQERLEFYLELMIIYWEVQCLMPRYWLMNWCFWCWPKEKLGMPWKDGLGGWECQGLSMGKGSPQSRDSFPLSPNYRMFMNSFSMFSSICFAFAGILYCLAWGLGLGAGMRGWLLAMAFILQAFLQLALLQMNFMLLEWEVQWGLSCSLSLIEGWVSTFSCEAFLERRWERCDSFPMLISELLWVHAFWDRLFIFLMEILGWGDMEKMGTQSYSPCRSESSQQQNLNRRGFACSLDRNMWDSRRWCGLGGGLCMGRQGFYYLVLCLSHYLQGEEGGEGRKRQERGE